MIIVEIRRREGDRERVTCGSDHAVADEIAHELRKIRIGRGNAQVLDPKPDGANLLIVIECDELNPMVSRVSEITRPYR